MRVLGASVGVPCVLTATSPMPVAVEGRGRTVSYVDTEMPAPMDDESPEAFAGALREAGTELAGAVWRRLEDSRHLTNADLLQSLAEMEAGHKIPARGPRKRPQD